MPYDRLRYQFIRPSPPRLSEHLAELRAIEESGTFSNFGPQCRTFEANMLDEYFEGRGAVATVCNATIGLILSIKASLRGRDPRRRFAILPSFTFAATALAAEWCNLTPVYVDVTPDSWLPCPEDLRRACEEFGSRTAVMLPYATFGSTFSIPQTAEIASQYDIPIVVDAASSLGACDSLGSHFGTGSPAPVVFSMHATKGFGTGEAGLVYSANEEIIKTIAQWSNFAFDEQKIVQGPGLNGKLSEISSLLCELKRKEYPAALVKRRQLAKRYLEALGRFQHQSRKLEETSYQFYPIAIPPNYNVSREDFRSTLEKHGVETRPYFSPPLHQHSYLTRESPIRNLPVTEDICNRVFALPLYESLSFEDVDEICRIVDECYDKM